MKLPGQLIPNVNAGPTRERWSTYDEAAEEIYLDGINPPGVGMRPAGDFPRLEETDLTNPDSREYTVKFCSIVSWLEYITELVAAAKAQQLELSEAIKQLGIDIKVRVRSEVPHGQKPPSADFLETLVEADEMHRAYKREYQKVTQKIMLLTPRLEGLENKYRLMSRVIELRRLDVEGAGRAENVPRRFPGRPDGRYR